MFCVSNTSKDRSLAMRSTSFFGMGAPKYLSKCCRTTCGSISFRKKMVLYSDGRSLRVFLVQVDDPFLLEWPISRGYVSFGEGIYDVLNVLKTFENW